MNLHILLVEDDEHLRYGLRFNLQQRGYDVTECATGEEALQAIVNEDGFACVILDVMLPGISGMEVLTEIRKKNERLPVAILTARSDESDAVLALSLGADDYIRKPFGVSELMARIQMLVRRRDMTAVSSKPQALGPWTLDLENFRVQQGKKMVVLTSMEVDLLSELLAHRGEVIRREDLLKRVWGVDSRTPTRTLDNHISRLRKKLESDAAHPQLILTVHGVGYKLG